MRKICVVSGTRADYGLLYWTMREILESEDFDLQVVATCMHLSDKFGATWRSFEDDGFEVSKKVELGELEDSKLSVIQQIATGLPKFRDAFKELEPELVIILGDRYEMLSAAQASFFLGIPIAHIHGGEVTEGAFDDMIRHSLTKMSTFHFCSNETYKKRIIRMGEFPENVLCVGAVGLESLRKMEFMSREEIEESLNFNLFERNLLITYHPVTAMKEIALENLLMVLSGLPDVGQIITLPNSDPGHERLFSLLKNYAEERKNVYLTESLGMRRYSSLMKLSDAVVGNSSSGILEAPFLGTPTVNIGSRQKGRLRDASVIDVGTSCEEIRNGLEKAMIMNCERSDLYGDGKSAMKILEFLRSRKFRVKMGFYDG